jgi:CRISPR/Cas system-associated exonuclease Cas4 (RecB family)
MLPSPSKHDRIAICPASAAYPQIDSIGSKWTTRGNVLHAFLAAVPSIGRDAALAAVHKDFRAACEVINLDRLRMVDPQSFASEEAYAYNVATGRSRVLGRGINRRYEGLGEDEIPGTTDVVGLTDDAAVVWDYKTGWHRYGPATTLRQLRTYALMAARAYGKQSARVGIVYVPESGEPRFDGGDLDAVELALIEEELRELAASVRHARAQVARGVMPKTVEGDHCRNCPAFQVCPAKMALVRQMAAAPESLEQLIENATDAQLAEAWKRAIAAEKVIERVKDVVKKRARETPLDLGDGYVLGLVKEDALDLDTSIAVLSVLHGIEVAQAAIEQEHRITKAGIERALRALVLKPGKKITHLKRDAIEAIRAAGGVGIRASVERYRPKPEELAAPALPTSEA